MSIRKSVNSVGKSMSSPKQIVSVKSNTFINTTVITLLYNVLVLIYIMNLEDKKCGCITDWRHDFIKYYCISIIIWSFVTIAFSLHSSKHGFVELLHTILMFASLINLWCLYTYVGDLDKTNCSCAINTQKNMHYFLYIWRYVLVGTLVLSLIGIILLSMGFVKS